jgi:hypothetical protein
MNKHDWVGWSAELMYDEDERGGFFLNKRGGKPRSGDETEA